MCVMWIRRERAKRGENIETFVEREEIGLNMAYFIAPKCITLKLTTIHTLKNLHYRITLFTLYYTSLLFSPLPIFCQQNSCLMK